jgi:hypothetical protein
MIDWWSFGVGCGVGMCVPMLLWLLWPGGDDDVYP